MCNCTVSALLAGPRRLARRFGGEEAGAVLIEMALITPFMLLLSAGVFEFSNIIHTRLLIEAGVEDAARYIARCSNDPSSTLWTSCVANAKNLAVNGSITGGTARVSGWTTADISLDPDPPACIAASVGGVEQYRSNSNCVYAVNVTGTYAYSGTGLWGYLGFGALTLTASHQERVVGW